MDLNPALNLLVLTEAFYWGVGGCSPKIDFPTGYNPPKNRGGVGPRPSEGGPGVCAGLWPLSPLVAASRLLPLPFPILFLTPRRAATAEGRSPPELK